MGLEMRLSSQSLLYCIDGLRRHYNSDGAGHDVSADDTLKAAVS